MEGIQVVDENLEIRLQRAASWMRLAKDLERAIDEPREASGSMLLPKWARAHELFIFYWIAFNALYGAEGEKEWPKLEAFLKKVETMAKLGEVDNISILEEAIQNCLSDGEFWINFLIRLTGKGSGTKKMSLKSAREDVRKPSKLWPKASVTHFFLLCLIISESYEIK